MSGDNLWITGGIDGISAEDSFSSGQILSDVELIHIKGIENEKCRPIALEYPVHYHSTILTSLGIMTCGGDNRTSVLNACMFQTKEGKTKSFPPMIRSRDRFGMVVVDQNLIVVGGFWVTNKMEKINLISGQWYEKDLPFMVSSHCVLSINDTIVVSIGGWGKMDGEWDVSKIF